VERPGVRPPGPVPAVAPTGPPAARNLEVGEATGEVKLVVAPWAQVTVDGRSLGSSPLKPVRLSPGSHVFVFEHPDYFPLQRKVVVKAGEVVQVDVDLRDVGFPRKKTKG
jgi:hypothetical protein